MVHHFHPSRSRVCSHLISPNTSLDLDFSSQHLCNSFIHVALSCSSAGPIYLRLRPDIWSQATIYDVVSAFLHPPGYLTPNPPYLVCTNIVRVLVRRLWYPSLPLTFSRLYMLSFPYTLIRRMAVSFSCHISLLRDSHSAAQWLVCFMLCSFRFPSVALLDIFLLHIATGSCFLSVWRSR